MSDPDAKDYQWLVARERGEDIGHVLASERAPYERVGALLAAGRRPSAGFRQRVLDAIDEAERAERAAQAEPPVGEAVPEAEVAPEAEIAPAPQPVPLAAPVEEIRTAEPVKPAPPAKVIPMASRRKRALWVAGGLAAAAAVAILVIRPGPRQPAAGEQLALVTEVRRGAVVHRSGSDQAHQANLHDTMIVRAEATGPAELRVYGGSDEHLIATCIHGKGCTVTIHSDRRRFHFEVPLLVPGFVHAVIFAGPNIPPSDGSLTRDLEAAAAAKVKIEQQRPPLRVL